MLSQEEWGRNVGTEGYPVTFLHEYAVGLIWDMLHAGGEGPVHLPTLDGATFEDVLADVDRVVIPDSLQPIGGYIPDLALYDKDLRVLRVIEVVVTSAPSQEKITSLTKRGVEVVVVPVRNEDELRALFPEPFDGKKPRWMHQRRQGEGRRLQSLNTIESRASPFIDELIASLVRCSPAQRRKLVALLEQMGDLESLYPLHPRNPKAKDLTQG